MEHLSFESEIFRSPNDSDLWSKIQLLCLRVKPAFQVFESLVYWRQTPSSRQKLLKFGTHLPPVEGSDFWKALGFVYVHEAWWNHTALNWNALPVVILKLPPKFILRRREKRVDIEFFHRYKYGNGFNFGCNLRQIWNRAGGACAKLSRTLLPNFPTRTSQGSVTPEKKCMRSANPFWPNLEP